ncbi:hypothetical protein Tco_0632813 [Tanacetum coccineum]
MQQNQGGDLGNTDDQPNVEAASRGHEYPFELSKPLPLIKDRSRQVFHVNYFINNDLEYLKGGSSSMKYTTSTTKTKDAKYDDIQGIDDMVPSEGDFPRLNLRDIEDMMLLLVQKKLSNPERDVIFDFNVALRMFTRRVVILKRVEDLQLGVESYQKKLNITNLETLMRSDELYKFCDGTLTSVRTILHDIASRLRMDYLPKRRWSKLDKRSRHGPSDAMHNPPQPLKASQKTLVSFLTEITRISIDFLTPIHQSDTKVLTMTMEILPESRSNKLCSRLEFYKLVENYGRFSQRYQMMQILEDLLKKIKITEDIS